MEGRGGLRVPRGGIQLLPISPGVSPVVRKPTPGASSDSKEVKAPSAPVIPPKPLSDPPAINYEKYGKTPPTKPDSSPSTSGGLKLNIPSPSSPFVVPPTQNQPPISTPPSNNNNTNTQNTQNTPTNTLLNTTTQTSNSKPPQKNPPTPTSATSTPQRTNNNNNSNSNLKQNSNTALPSPRTGEAPKKPPPTPPSPGGNESPKKPPPIPKRSSGAFSSAPDLKSSSSTGGTVFSSPRNNNNMKNNNNDDINREIESPNVKQIGDKSISGSSSSPQSSSLIVQKKPFSRNDLLKIHPWIQSIVSLESTYISDLEILLNELMKPMMEKNIISNEEKDLLFCNIEEIIDLHKEFLHNFENNGLTSDSIIDFIADAFNDVSSKYNDAYTKYCSHQFDLIDHIVSLQKSNSLFNSFISDAFSQLESYSRDFQTYFLRPYTNIQKYSQIIPNFLVVIDEFEIQDDQKDKLDSAQQSLSDLVIDINQIIYHRNPSLYELIQIHQLIENSEDFRLISFQRYFIAHEEVEILGKNRIIYLFNDCFAITAKRLDECLYLKRIVSLHTILFQADNHDKTSVQIAETGHSLFNVKFKTQQSRNYFIATINSQTKQMRNTNEEFYQYLTSSYRNSGIDLQLSDTYTPLFPPDTSFIEIFFSELLPKQSIHSEEEYEEEILKFSLLMQFEKDTLLKCEHHSSDLHNKHSAVQTELTSSISEIDENISLLSQLMDKLTSENISLQHRIKNISNRLKTL